MGGNAASLRFDATQQRGSRDNDYLTAASHADIGRLMDAFECIDADDGWAIWQQALATAALVPASRARRFKNTLAELAKSSQTPRWRPTARRPTCCCGWAARSVS